MACITLAVSLVMVLCVSCKQRKPSNSDQTTFTLIPGKDSIALTYYGVTMAEDSIAKAAGKVAVPHELYADTSATAACGNENQYPPCIVYNVKPGTVQGPQIMTPPWLLSSVRVRVVSAPGNVK